MLKKGVLIEMELRFSCLCIKGNKVLISIIVSVVISSMLFINKLFL